MFNFWFDLSKSLIELLGEEATREEINFAKYIEISSNVSIFPISKSLFIFFEQF